MVEMMPFLLGAHTILSTPEALAFARVAPVVKSIDNINIFHVARPDALRIFRHYFASQNLNDGVGAAKAIIAALQGYRQPHLYAEVWNEAFPTPAQLTPAIEMLHAAGVKVAGPSWATGSFQQHDWEMFRVTGWCGLDLISLHCYFGMQGFTQWEGVRYRQFWRPGDPSIVITECGMDDV